MLKHFPCFSFPEDEPTYTLLTEPHPALDGIAWQSHGKPFDISLVSPVDPGVPTREAFALLVSGQILQIRQAAKWDVELSWAKNYCSKPQKQKKSFCHPQKPAFN